MASAGPSAMACSNAALISAPLSSLSSPARIAPSPSFGLRPAAASVSPYCAKTSGKKARTTWPKMIGSDTFIIVALRWTENSTPSSFARWIWAVRNSRSGPTRMAVASTISWASTGTDSRSTVLLPSSPVSVMVRVSSAGSTADFSEERKSSAVMCATLVFDCGDHAPMRCGCLRAYCFTDAGARRSELPSRSTGFTALPLVTS